MVVAKTEQTFNEQIENASVVNEFAAEDGGEPRFDLLFVYMNIFWLFMKVTTTIISVTGEKKSDFQAVVQFQRRRSDASDV